MQMVLQVLTHQVCHLLCGENRTRNGIILHDQAILVIVHKLILYCYIRFVYNNKLTTICNITVAETLPSH